MVGPADMLLRLTTCLNVLMYAFIPKLVIIRGAFSFGEGSA